jgi:hypothetical protein
MKGRTMKAYESISDFISVLNTANSNSQQVLQYYLVVFSYSATALIIIIESLLNLRNEIKRMHVITKWSPVKAKILRSKIAVESLSSSESVQVLDFEYMYTVEGTEYTSKTIPKYFIDHFRMDLDKRIIQQFPEGSETQVYFNPENPGEAILLHRESASAFVNCIFLCFFWIGVMVVCSQILIGFAISRVCIILLVVFLSIYIPVKMKRNVHN